MKINYKVGTLTNLKTELIDQKPWKCFLKTAKLTNVLNSNPFPLPLCQTNLWYFQYMWNQNKIVDTTTEEYESGNTQISRDHQI